MITTAVLLATLGVAPPPRAELDPCRDGPRSDGALVVRMVEHATETSRRRRVWRSSLSLSLGSLQAGLGLYGVASPHFDAAMRRSLAAQILLGATGMSLGAYGLVRLSPMERLYLSPEYAALAQDPSNEDALRRLRVQWAARARWGRTWRAVKGAGYVAAGLSLLAAGAMAGVFDPADHERHEILWSFTTAGSGVGLVLAGSLDLTIPSPIEQTYAAHADLFGWPPYRRPPPWSARPRRRAQLRVGPTLGGVVVFGRF